jgi:hypothetical protein
MMVLMMAALTAGSAAASEGGAGGYFTNDFGGGLEYSGPGGSVSVETPYKGGGGFVFLSLDYAELSLGIFHAGGSFTARGIGSASGSAHITTTGLDIGLLLKYPVQYSEQLVFFPLLGIAYRLMISVKEDGVDIEAQGIKSTDFNAFWFKGGGGLDYAFNAQMFVRAALLYGIRLKNTYEKDLIDASGGILDSRLGHGLDIKLAIGYRF